MRVAALLAVGVNPDNPVITHNEMVWANRFTLHGTEVMIARFESGKVGEPIAHIQQHEALYTLLLEYAKASIAGQWKPTYETNYGISITMFQARSLNYRYIHNKLHKRPAFSKAHNTPAALKGIIESFANTGYLKKISGTDSRRGNRTGDMWEIQQSILVKS